MRPPTFLKESGHQRARPKPSGDPVAATRQCLQALVEQVGNHRVILVGTTGSARELAGAYLGTAHVYNEISAHAAGANHLDGAVETIFEIGCHHPQASRSQ